MARDSDWEKIKTEYITSSIGLRKLCIKHSVPYSSISRRSISEGWVDKRKQYKLKVVSKSVEKIANKEAEKLANLKKSTDKMTKVILNALEDDKQFNRHIVQKKFEGIINDPETGPYMGKLEEAEEKQFDKYDTKAIRELTSAMKDLTLIIRDLYDMPSLEQHTQMDIATERLIIEKKKNDMLADKDNKIIIELAGDLKEWGV